MTSNKTLIVFDTNKLRSTIKGGPSYGTFEFSKEFQDIQSFIENKKLSGIVHLAIPRIVLDELLMQKFKQFQKDFKNFPFIQKRLQELFKFKSYEIKVPEKFNCEKILNQLLEKTISEHNLTIIYLPERDLEQIFKKIILRSLRKKSPFKQSSKGSSDIGFKDVLLWESLLNYPRIKDYYKIILVTSDSGFDEKCEEEFETIIKKYITIVPSSELVISEIEKDYGVMVKHKEFFDFANSDYFKEYISKELSKLKSIEIRRRVYKIKKLEVIQYFSGFEEEFKEEETGDIIPYVITSLMKGIIKIKGSDKTIKLRARTFLDDKKGITGTQLIVGEK